jgi:tRNA(Ser,Leu) C12 N-acetylase TAN1
MTGEQSNDDRTAWNVLVTSQEGTARELRRLIKQYGNFRWSGFRNVLLGQVPDPLAFLRALLADLEQKPFAQNWLGKALPITTTFPVRPETFVQDVESRLAALVDEVGGKSFHVRVERRGHKGELHTHELEQRFGAYLWQQLEAHHAQPAVSFRDPDVVIAIEIAGPTAGIAVISRQLRDAFPFVKID